MSRKSQWSTLSSPRVNKKLNSAYPITGISVFYLVNSVGLAIPTFNDLEKETFENNAGKGENAGNQHFLLFPQCFLRFPNRFFNFLYTLILSSANAFNSDQYKILSFGKEFFLSQHSKI